MMKRTLLIVGLLGIALTSCSDTTEEFAAAAAEMCECMQESNDDSVESSDLEMNMAVCLLGSKVNLKDSNMLIQVERKCPELKQEFIAFLKRMESK